ncbi:lanthionine synthetase C family protein [Kitasatospora sp. NPDC008050]|uniref:lanthionine synthetase C family protein n=1 Tax=Kitasatospora sp. NPDC008050 TaxID=3364021 RepID=UPI0036F17D40
MTTPTSRTTTNQTATNPTTTNPTTTNQSATDPSATDPSATTRIGTTVERVADALAAPREPLPQGPDHRVAPAVSLEGAAGAALFLAELARHDPDRLPAAHAQLTVAAKGLTGTGSVGLIHGPAAVLAAVQAVARLGGHYPRLRHNLTAHVASTQLARSQARSEAPGVGWSSYDLINGTAGTARLLLTAVTEGDEQERAAAEPALRAALGQLVAVCAPAEVDGLLLPGWWVPQDRQPTEADRRLFPRGDFNLGMAHGMAGPLALFARCTELGVTVDGQLEAMHRVGDWLADRADHDAFGPYWEPRLPFDDEVARGRGERTPPSHFAAAASGGAWCYGAAGIANALLRAAEFTGEDAWRHLALDSAHALLSRPDTGAHLKGPTVCHGQAGFLQSLWRLGRLAGDQLLLDHAATLADQLAGQWDAQTPFGYQHLAPATRDGGWDRSQPMAGQDNIGVLEGAAGVAAALLSVLPRPGQDGTELDEPSWDRVLLLS